MIEDDSNKFHFQKPFQDTNCYISGKINFYQRCLAAMHCIRAFFSIVLLVSSLSWFTLRSLLSLSTNINDLFGDSVDFEQFKKDWCKIRRQKIEWREVLSPCMDILKNATLNGNARYMHKL